MPDYRSSDDYNDGLEIALVHYRNQDWTNAEIFIRQFISGYPDKAEGWFILGMVAKQKGNQKLAEECLEQAFKMKLNPIPPGFTE